MHFIAINYLWPENGTGGLIDPLGLRGVCWRGNPPLGVESEEKICFEFASKKCRGLCILLQKNYMYLCPETRTGGLIDPLGS